MNAKQLAAFRAVMLAGSMSEASEMLYVSQPAVSRLIKDLEESLGFALFERRSSRLFPTPEAHAFFVEVRRHFIGLDNLTQAADQIRMNKRGRLRIAAMPALAFSCLPRVVSRFLQGREDVSLSLAPHNSVEVTNLLGAHQADLGIVMLPVESSEISFGPCYEVECRCVAPAGHRFEAQAEVAAAALNREPFITIGEQNTVTRFRIDAALKASLVKPDQHIETPLFVTVQALVAQGLGVSIIDPFTAELHAAQGGVSRPFKPSIPFYFGFITPLNRPPAGLAQEFISCFEALAGASMTLKPVDPHAVGVAT